MSRESIIKYISLITIAFLIFACGFPTTGKKEETASNSLTLPVTSPTTAPTQAEAVKMPEGVYPPGFGDYTAIEARMPQSFSGGYTLPVSLAGVEGVDSLDLSEQQKSQLEQNGFVVETPVTGEYQEFYQIYEDNRYEMVPMFVTTDSVFHVYHLLFDKILRDLERDYFHPVYQGINHGDARAEHRRG